MNGRSGIKVRFDNTNTCISKLESHEQVLASKVLTTSNDFSFMY